MDLMLIKPAFAMNVDYCYNYTVVYVLCNTMLNCKVTKIFNTLYSYVQQIALLFTDVNS